MEVHGGREVDKKWWQQERTNKYDNDKKKRGLHAISGNQTKAKSAVIPMQQGKGKVVHTDDTHTHTHTLPITRFR